MGGTSDAVWPFVGRESEMGQIQAAVAHRGARAVIITAPAGAGKTRLLLEATTAVGLSPLRIQATPGASTIPLGALAEIIELDHHSPVVTQSAFRSMEIAVENAGGVVVVDDIPLLDSHTSDILQRLADKKHLTLLATARSGVPIPAWLEWLWLSDQTTHIELGPLGPTAIKELLTTIIEDLSPVEYETLAHDLAERTKGNSLFLRELLQALRSRLAAGESASIEAPPHLLRVLDARIGAPDSPARQVLSTVSVLGSLPISILASLCDRASIDESERGSWISVSEDGRRSVHPSHPLYGEAVLGAMTATERFAETERVSMRVLSDAGATANERLRATAALSAQGSVVERSHLVDGAQTAFASLDHSLAIELASRALDSGPCFDATLVLGAALSGAGRPEDAESAIRDALASAKDDDELARGAGRLSVHLVAHGGRIDEAAALLDEIEPLITDVSARSFLAADKAKLASIRGDLTNIDAGSFEGDDLAALNSAIVGAYAQAMAADPQNCMRTIERALPLAEAHRSILPWSSELVRFSATFAALCSHGPAAALREADAGLHQAAISTVPTVGTWAFLSGFSNAVGGNLQTACESLSHATSELVDHDLINARPIAIATKAWVLAQSGQSSKARDLIDTVLDAAVLDGRVRVQISVADAWCDFAETRTLNDATETKLLTATDQALETAQVLTAAIVLNELVRLGGASSAVDKMDKLAESTSRPWLISFVLERAKATASSNSRKMSELAASAATSWPVASAEMNHWLSIEAQRMGDEAATARHRFEAFRASEALGPLKPVTLIDVVDPLSAREREVAISVGAGLSNRAIAELGGVSVRTVENQVQNVYRKLGLSNRGELGAHFQN